MTGQEIGTAAADAGYAFLRRPARSADPGEAGKSRVPPSALMKCPRGKVRVRATRSVLPRQGEGLRLPAQTACPSRAGAIIATALLRGRRRTLRSVPAPFWRSEGFHGETKTQHGLRRAVRRGLGNMKIQSLTRRDQPEAARGRFPRFPASA